MTEHLTTRRSEEDSLRHDAGLKRAQSRTAMRLLEMTPASEVESDLDGLIGEQHAQSETFWRDRLKSQDLSDEERVQAENAREWHQQKQAERAYIADPTLPRPDHLPAPMTAEELAASKAKVDSVSLRR